MGAERFGRHQVRHGCDRRWFSAEENGQVGDFMASLPLGLLRATQCSGEVAQGQVKQGAKDIGLGALQASQIPSTFFAGPEVGEVG